MQEALRGNISALTDRFASLTGLKASTILARAANDARFLDRTGAGGKTFTIRLYENALQWFSDNWPADAVWPADIPRPEPPTGNARPHAPQPSPKPTAAAALSVPRPIPAWSGAEEQILPDEKKVERANEGCR